VHLAQDWLLFTNERIKIYTNIMLFITGRQTPAFFTDVKCLTKNAASTFVSIGQDGWSPAIMEDYGGGGGGGGSANGDRHRRLAHEDDSTLNEDDEEEVDGGNRFNNSHYAHRHGGAPGGGLQSDSETDRGGTPIRY
jgi:hypothetical protein